MVDCNGSEATPNRFVCPNDRQLALRAKLKAGWSMKTASFGYQSTPVPLGEDEQATIIEVIRRAEQVELHEQERVGRLVERLENMRKNALGRGPTQCLLCGDRFGILGAHKMRCIDCHRLVCHKCAIEGYCSKFRSPARDHCLCMICAETREIWKKSGAWFFKSLPKYVIPNQKLTNVGKKRGSRGSGTGRATRDDDSSSDDDGRPSLRRLTRKNLNTESTNDAVEPLQDNMYLQQAKSYSRQTSSTDSQMSKDMEPLKQHLSTMTLNEAKSWDEAMSEGRNSDWVSNGSDLSRHGSFASRSISELNWSDRSNDRISASVSSTSSSVLKNPVEERKSIDTSMGTMELSLAYDPNNMTLHCAVYRAKNLIPMDINGLSDPFCKLNILPNAKTSTRLRTKTVHKTRNPEFNETLTFYEICDDDLLKRALHIMVLDDDKYGHDYMGETKVGLAKLRVQNTVYLNVPLEKLRSEQKGPLPQADLNQWFDDLWLRGQILLSLCYSTKRRSLLVTVIKCANLLPMDNNGFSDPFVKLQLRPNPCHRKHKTTIKWKNLNPTFNEEFTFETRPTELSTQSLYITVWDKDYGKSNDYLGGLILGGIGSKGHRLKHWLDMIRYPDHRHEYWHNLTEDLINV